MSDDSGKKKKGGDALKMPIAVLKADPKNARKISGDSIAGLTVSVAAFGDLSGIVWNKRTGHLVCGHQRIKVLREAGAVSWKRDGDDGSIEHPKNVTVAALAAGRNSR